MPMIAKSLSSTSLTYALHHHFTFFLCVHSFIFLFISRHKKKKNQESPSVFVAIQTANAASNMLQACCSFFDYVPLIKSLCTQRKRANRCGDEVGLFLFLSRRLEIMVTLTCWLTNSVAYSLEKSCLTCLFVRFSLPDTKHSQSFNATFIWLEFFRNAGVTKPPRIIPFVY